MKAQVTDAELISALKLLKTHGTPSKAAAASGIPERTLSSWVQRAKAKGFTSASVAENETDNLRAKLKLVEHELATIQKANDDADSIRKTIYRLKALPMEQPTWITKKRPAGLPGVPMALWSDWHWGERVFKDQVGGVNEFNRSIAIERLHRLVDITLDLALHHMVNPQYPGIVVCLGGDMISGGIHEELRETNEGPINECIQELRSQIAAALKILADRFGKVFVPCVVGNHGRATLKPRAKHRVIENHEWNLYTSLEAHFNDIGDKRVQFLIPRETDAYFTVLGHRFLLTHGDTLGVKGGDGIIGAIGPIARGAFKVGRSEAQIGRDFDTLLLGHWHTYIPRGEAAPVIVNGALKGYDEYARLMLRVPYSRPSQALWFVHGKHGITAQWQIYLDEVKKSSDTAEWVTWEKRST
jgi:hypothetical protein